MKFKQWLKHREQSEQQPTQPVPSKPTQLTESLTPVQSGNLPALQPCHWNQHRIHTVQLIRRALSKLPCDVYRVEFRQTAPSRTVYDSIYYSVI